MTTNRILVSSGPRNISTALMYSFAQRADTRVIDEPLYAHYLSTTPARAYHPGADDVLKEQSCNGREVVERLILGPTDKPVLFVKNMTHHLVNLEWDFLTQVQNVILTRDPREMLTSFAKNIQNIQMHDTGYDLHIDLLDFLQKHGQMTPVLDSKEVLKDPWSVLSQLCQRLDIPFDEEMLRWEAGPRPEDGSWAKYWYHSVHQSTGFQPYRAKEEEVPKHLYPLLEECIPLYERLSALSIRAE